MAQLSAVDVRALVARGDRAAAGEALAGRISALLGRPVMRVRITSDEYSLNSVSGLAELDSGGSCFFKFHTEEDEGEHAGEYYRARVLEEAGLPVDVPLAASTGAGEQLVLYRRRTEPRMVDVCRDLERAEGDAATMPPELLTARRELDRVIGEVVVRTLALGDGSRAALHRLFSHRMHETDGSYPGGRLRRWYLDHPEGEGLRSRRWALNGVEYADSLDAVVHRARDLLDPGRMGRGPVVTAHGDDHHGNVWVEDGPRLELFDPAFAGDDLPALLALAKPTFHNVFAHPAWLYHPAEVDADRLRVDDDGVTVRVSAPPLSPLRQQVLDSALEHAWTPLLRALADRGWLDPTWRATVRSALAMCPLLVTDLVAESRPPDVRALGLAVTVMMGSEPAGGTDALTGALDRMQESIEGRRSRPGDSIEGRRSRPGDSGEGRRSRPGDSGEGRRSRPGDSGEGR